MLDDVLEPGLSVVFCGTAAGARSAAVKQYYAGKGNKFWHILYEVGLTPRLLAPFEFALLPVYGIGLTDIVKGQAGPDEDIVFHGDGVRRVRDEMLQYQPRFLCFNGKRSAKEFLRVPSIAYGLQTERIGDTRLYVAPSTSAAANGSWDPVFWRQLAALTRAASP